MKRLFKRTVFQNKKVVKYPYNNIHEAVLQFLKYEFHGAVSLNNNYLYPCYSIRKEQYFVLTHDDIIETNADKSLAFDKLIFFGKTLFFFRYDIGLNFINQYIQNNQFVLT